MLGPAKLVPALRVLRIRHRDRGAFNRVPDVVDELDLDRGIRKGDVGMENSGGVDQANTLRETSNPT